MMRGVKSQNLQGLRKRISTLFLHYIKTPLFNPEAARHIKVLYFFSCILFSSALHCSKQKWCHLLLEYTWKTIFLVKSLLSDYFLCWSIKLTHFTSLVSGFPTLNSVLFSEPALRWHVARRWGHRELPHLCAFHGLSLWAGMPPLRHPDGSCGFSCGFSNTWFPCAFIYMASQGVKLCTSEILHAPCLCSLRILLTSLQLLLNRLCRYPKRTSDVTRVWIRWPSPSPVCVSCSGDSAVRGQMSALLLLTGPDHLKHC